MRYVRMGAWRSVGPYHLTKCINNYRGAPYNGITILPSQMFSPKHFRGNSYTGNGIVYADHQWGTTKKLYTAGVLNVDFSRAGRQSAMAQNGESSPSSSIQFAAQ
jgi:hypothetical protein